MENNSDLKISQSLQVNSKSDLTTSEKEKEKEKSKNKDKGFHLNNSFIMGYIKPKELSDDCIAETEAEPETEMVNANYGNIINNDTGLNRLPTINSIIRHEETIKRIKTVEIPGEQMKKRIVQLEKQLFKLMNIGYGEEIIYEDFILVNNNENYYVHLLRTANLDPNKENFLLIHGFLSSSTHFLSVLPYLLLKYNVFIPDTIGMGLSSRPQIDFKTPKECEDYFIEIIYILVKKIFFQKKI